MLRPILSTLHFKDFVLLAFRFHPGFHGGGRRALDVANFMKIVLDSIAAGLFCDQGTEPYSIKRWDFDDSNFSTPFVHYLVDTPDAREEGVALFVSSAAKRR